MAGGVAASHIGFVSEQAARRIIRWEFSFLARYLQLRRPIQSSRGSLMRDDVHDSTAGWRPGTLWAAVGIVGMVVLVDVARRRHACLRNCGWRRLVESTAAPCPQAADSLGTVHGFLRNP